MATSSPEQQPQKWDKRNFLFHDIPKSIRKQLKMDSVAEYSVTDANTAESISEIIMQVVGAPTTNLTITDGTACVGGNVINFGMGTCL